MKRIGILGAGVSGLSIGQLLKGRNGITFEILERHPEFGGIARTKQVDGATYHPIGGHCFNSKHQDVLDFVFGLMPKDQWHIVKRNANIKLDGMDVGYPIEYSIGQIYRYDKELAVELAKDFMEAIDTGSYANLEDWFYQKFGRALAEKYFVPYNRKIWNRDPSMMSHEWVVDKLPIPNKVGFIESLIDTKKDQMPHATFYYPNSNDQSSFLRALANGLDITLNYEIKSLEYSQERGVWLINGGDKEFDVIVSTLPLNLIPYMIEGTPAEVLEHADKLKFNKVTTMFWSTNGTERTWSYNPTPHGLYHRQIHIGNFFSPKRNVSITEAVGERSYEEMVSAGRDDPFLVEPLDYHVSEHAYVVFDANSSHSKQVVLSYLRSRGVYTLGRFGEWEYYNMDICIKQAMNLVGEIAQ